MKKEEKKKRHAVPPTVSHGLSKIKLFFFLIIPEWTSWSVAYAYESVDTN